MVFPLRNPACIAALGAGIVLLWTALPAGGEAMPDQGPNLLDNVRPKPEAQRSAASIRVDVELALVPVTVVDPLGRNVLGLARDNFQLYDNKKPRRIVSFSRQDAPVSVGIVFDASGSMSEKLRSARSAVAELVRELNPHDEAFLVGIGDRPEMRLGLTSNLGELGNSLLFTKAAGKTALIDGVYMALQRVGRAHNPRRALVVVSDGGDNNSRYTYSELMSYAEEADTQIYTIGLVANPHTPEEAAGADLLANLSKRTGGRAFIVNTPRDMQDAMARIGVTLHNEYVLGYYPPDDAPAGKYRKIKVELKVPHGLPRLQIYARRGIYTPYR